MAGPSLKPPDGGSVDVAAARALTAQRRALQPLWNALDDVGSDVDAGCVVAVSGGPDSRALVEAFARWPGRDAARARSVVVVVDHGRRPSAAAEAEAVVAVAAGLGLAAVVKRIAVDKGDEATLREARYRALFEAAEEASVDVVVTAHHRGDVAEGVLLHLVGRGGGRGGRAPHVVEARGRHRIVRPFLDVTKATLQGALDALGITDVVIDEDDAAGRNARGLLRKQVLAPLAGLRPDVEAALARHARHRRDDDDVLDALVPADADDVDAALPPALLRRWLMRRIAAVAAVDDPRSGAASIDAVLDLCAGGRVGDVDLRGCRAEIRRVGDGLRLRLVATS